MSEQKKTIVTVGENEIQVDTSDEACLEFGFKSGDRVNIEGYGKGEVAGVANGLACASDKRGLWILVDNRGGKAQFTSTPRRYLTLLP